MKFWSSPHYALALILLAGLAAPTAADTYADRLERTFDTGPDVAVTLANTNGSVRVEAWDEDVVDLVAEKRVSSGNSNDAREALEAIEVIIRESRGRLEIETRLPSMTSGFLDWILGRSRNAQVRYELRVPRGAEVDLRTVNGPVTTRGIGGRQELSSTNGGLVVEAAANSVEARTTNGGIRVEIVDDSAGPDVRLGSTNGGVTLDLPEDLRGRIEARTVNGRVTCDLPVTIQGSNSRRRLTGDLNGGGTSRIEISTTNGGIKIRSQPRDAE